MTASVESLAELIAQRVGRDWLYSPSPGAGVLDFTVDDKHFRILVLDDALDIEGVVVYRATDVSAEYMAEVERHLTATEAAQIARAQDLAAPKGEIVEE